MRPQKNTPSKMSLVYLSFRYAIIYSQVCNCAALVRTLCCVLCITAHVMGVQRTPHPRLSFRIKRDPVFGTKTLLFINTNVKSRQKNREIMEWPSHIIMAPTLETFQSPLTTVFWILVFVHIIFKVVALVTIHVIQGRVTGVTSGSRGIPSPGLRCNLSIWSLVPPRASPSWTCLEHFPRESPRWHPNQTPQPPPLAPLNAKEQQIYSLSSSPRPWERRRPPFGWNSFRTLVPTILFRSWSNSRDQFLFF